MKFLEYPALELEFFAEPGRLEGPVLSSELLARAGVFVLRGLVSPALAADYLGRLQAGLSDGSARPRQNHLTEVSFELESPLAGILREPEFAALLTHFFDGQVGLHNIRIVRKDEHNTEAVFIHQDSPYCLGFFERYSLFVALSDCGPDNGGLTVYPGTHHFGYLGDAGAVREELTRPMYKFAPELSPGDCLIMHSAVWHGSPRSVSRLPRVMFDIQIQAVRDPSSILSLCEQPLSPWRLRLDNQDVFSTSRVQRAASHAK